MGDMAKAINSLHSSPKKRHSKAAKPSENSIMDIENGLILKTQQEILKIGYKPIRLLSIYICINPLYIVAPSMSAVLYVCNFFKLKLGWNHQYFVQSVYTHCVLVTLHVIPININKK
jgi:hypothetical protein